MAKKNGKKVEAETKVDPKIQAVMDDLANAVNSLIDAEISVGEVTDVPEALANRIHKMGGSLDKSVKSIGKQLGNLAGKAEKAAAKEVRAAAAAGKKVEKLAKLVEQQTKLAERIAKMQA